jgi:hypothetical protein
MCSAKVQQRFVKCVICIVLLSYGEATSAGKLPLFSFGNQHSRDKARATLTHLHRYSSHNRNILQYEFDDDPDVYDLLPNENIKGEQTNIDDDFTAFDIDWNETEFNAVTQISGSIFLNADVDIHDSFSEEEGTNPDSFSEGDIDLYNGFVHASSAPEEEGTNTDSFSDEGNIDLYNGFVHAYEQPPPIRISRRRHLLQETNNITTERDLADLLQSVASNKVKPLMKAPRNEAEVMNYVTVIIAILSTLASLAGFCCYKRVTLVTVHHHNVASAGKITDPNAQPAYAKMVDDDEKKILKVNSFFS